MYLAEILPRLVSKAGDQRPSVTTLRLRAVVIETSLIPHASARFLAEEKGFEPLVGCPTAVFKTAALDHSATPPDATDGSRSRR